MSPDPAATAARAVDSDPIIESDSCASTVPASCGGELGEVLEKAGGSRVNPVWVGVLPLVEEEIRQVSPLLQPRVLDHVVGGVLDEMPGELGGHDLHEFVLEERPAGACIDGQGAAIGEACFGVLIVDFLGFLGLIFDRFVFAVLGVFHLVDDDMNLGVAVHDVEIAWGLDLELFHFEEDDDVGVEVVGDFGGIGVAGMGFHPGCGFVGVDDGDFFDLFAQDEREFAGEIAFDRGEFAECA